MRINKHLKDRFGAREASSIGKPDITEYMDDRLAAKKATINRELSIIRRALNLGVEHGIIPMSPFIEQFDESDNVRQGFIEYDTYLRIMRNLPTHQHMLWCFAYHLGIRKGELLKLRWEWLLPYWNEEKPIIKVPGELCKNKKPHTIPIYGDMVHFVEMAIAERDPNCPWLFQYRGRRLKNVRQGFDGAREAAKLPKLLFHDTRRTAIRNMEQAGIPRAEAMQISGHRTEAVYKRYDIASERGARAAGERMEDFHRRIREASGTQNKLVAKLVADLDDKGEGQISTLPSKYKN
jgi:integrase